MKYSKLACILPIIAISACGSTPEEYGTGSEFKRVIKGKIPHTLSRVSTQTVTTGLNNTGYTYVVGRDSDNVYQAFAGLIIKPALSVSPPTTGTATMTGKYSATRVYNIATTDTVPRGVTVGNSGLTLEADFANGTLKGGDPAKLFVNGTFNSGSLSLRGTVSYFGVDGRLLGRIGPDQAIGAFRGHDDTSVFAGGFVVSVP